MKTLSAGIARLAAIFGLVGLLLAGSPAPAGASSGDAPTRTPIKHFVTLMQENHSFDNYFGTYPGADGIPKDTCMPVDPAKPGSAPCVKPYHIGDSGIADLGHSERIFDRQVNGGKMDGFVEAFARDGLENKRQPMGYYDDRDIPFYWNVADNHVLFDRFFTSSHGSSVSNHMYWVTGTPGDAVRPDVIPEEGFDIPTIFDRLEEKGVSWKFYVQNYDPANNLRNRETGPQSVWVPLLNYPRYLDDPALFGKIVPLEEYYTDLALGTLPAVSYIVPSGMSEHPPGSVQAGQAFVRTLINSLMRSSAWSTSAFMWAYDDWGGWYDHVLPPKIDDFGLGFRTPALLVSAYAKAGHVDHTQLDFTSMLKFIEQNWGLTPLAERDAKANNFLSAFDFGRGSRPAVFLPASRTMEMPPKPKGGVVYASYGGALGIFALVVSAASLRGRRARLTSREA